MSLKEEINSFTKNAWGIGVIISWIIFIIFAFWNMIWAFILTAVIPLYAIMGVISLLLIGSAALYLLTVLIVAKSEYSTEQFYFAFSFIPLGLLFVLSIITGYIAVTVLLWPYSVLFIASIAIILCTHYYIETKEVTPSTTTTV